MGSDSDEEERDGDVEDDEGDVNGHTPPVYIGSDDELDLVS